MLHGSSTLCLCVCVCMKGQLLIDSPLSLSLSLQLANAFTSLSDTCQRFHESGVEHYKSASKMVSCVQSIGGLCNNSLGQSVSGPMQKVCRWLSGMLSI